LFGFRDRLKPPAIVADVPLVFDLHQGSFLPF
jgi:hypothetical protein